MKLYSRPTQPTESSFTFDTILDILIQCVLQNRGTDTCAEIVIKSGLITLQMLGKIHDYQLTSFIDYVNVSWKLKSGDEAKTCLIRRW